MWPKETTQMKTDPTDTGGAKRTLPPVVRQSMEGKKMDRLSCGTCKHLRDVGYRNWGECTAPVPRWAWFEYIVPTRQVFRDGSTADFAPDCEAYTPNNCFNLTPSVQVKQMFTNKQETN